MSVPAPPRRSPGPLRLVQVGAGGMGETWLHTIAASPDVTLVGLVDLDLDRARVAADACGHPGVPVANSLADLAADQLEAVVNVTVPAAHRSVNAAALSRGLPVLCEKPLSSSVAECLLTVAAAELSGQLLMVSQSRRYWRPLDALRGQLSALGRIGSLSCEFFRAPRFGGFRDRMDYPLLVDMAIHQFDLARLLLGADPVSVYCESYNPPWSWLRGDAAAAATFAFPDGTRFTFDGSWVAPGQETSWNGRWRVTAEHGSAVWDGDAAPEAVAAGEPLPSPLGDRPEETAGSLAEFVAAVRGGPVPDTEVHRNVVSVAMVEAAIASAEAGRPVLLADVLESAYAVALRTVETAAVADVLRSWTSVTAAVAAGPR